MNNYLSFDRNLLVDLERSLKKEILRTNRSGAYNSTTIVDCNTRKYHGQLVIPMPNLDNENHVLLSSLDETIIQYGAEFNLGVHKYDNNHYSPNGHKYLRQFDYNVVSTSIYRLGGVIISKERLMLSHEPRVLIKYKLLEGPTIGLRLKPFLAFRSVNALCQENDVINKNYTEVENGIEVCLYQGYPCLLMQCSKKTDYYHSPDWYRGIEYAKEQERGYAYKEDLYVPGYLELSMKKGEEVIFSAGIEEVSPRKLKTLWDNELAKRTEKNSLFDYLKNSATQFYKKDGNIDTILAGYPWFKSRARDEFISLPGATLCIGDVDYFEKVLDSSVPDIRKFIEIKDFVPALQELESPDVLLWFIWTIQQYAIYTSKEQMIEKYGKIVVDVVTFLRSQKHKNLFLHPNGLLYTEGRGVAVTWMNAMENGHPITPRTGYIVEINALWFNALEFASEISRTKQEEQHTADLFHYQAEIVRKSFLEKFWNGAYLNDYVIDNYQDKEVRPNMIFAVSLPYSPLDRMQQKAVLDICTKELLTPKGLRSLSPKSGSYRPMYVGGQLERDRNYHNGPVWPWLIGAFAEAYLKVYKNSGVSFIKRIMIGFEGAIRERCIGTIAELYDGNPPFNGHGAMSFAMNVAEILRVLTMLKNYDSNNK